MIHGEQFAPKQTPAPYTGSDGTQAVPRRDCWSLWAAAVDVHDQRLHDARWARHANLWEEDVEPDDYFHDRRWRELRTAELEAEDEVTAAEDDLANRGQYGGLLLQRLQLAADRLKEATSQRRAREITISHPDWGAFS